jgi:hypothetical protein
VKKVFNAAQVELYGGGGTDMCAGLRWFIERTSPPIDLLVVVSDCQTPWPDDAPPFPVITIRVGDGAPAQWSDRGANKLITIEDTPPVDDIENRWQRASAAIQRLTNPQGSRE